MKFIQKTDGSIWFWDEERMRCENFDGGWHPIDENSPEWMEAKIFEADNWHDLYEKTGYIGMFGQGIENPDVWISPEGAYFAATGHFVVAGDLVEYLYGADPDDPEDFLLERGWAKASRSFMWHFYMEDYRLWNRLTYQSEDAVLAYCDYHRLKYPIPIVERKEFEEHL